MRGENFKKLVYQGRISLMIVIMLVLAGCKTATSPIVTIEPSFATTTVTTTATDIIRAPMLTHTEKATITPTKTPSPTKTATLTSIVTPTLNPTQQELYIQEINQNK